MKTLILAAILASVTGPVMAQVYRPQPTPLPNMQQPIYQPPAPQPVYTPQYNPPMQYQPLPQRTVCQVIGNMVYCH